MIRTSRSIPKGFSLIEVAVAATLLSIMISLSAPAIGRALDRWTVRAATDELVSIVHRARWSAQLHGGSTLLLLPDSAVELRAGDSLRARWSGVEAGIELGVGREEPVELRWDALGVGEVASRTLTLTRGRVGDTLVLASTGRVSRR